MQDITDRRKGNRALRLFRALIDHSNDAVEVIDPDTLRFLDVNLKACQDVGYTREELLGLTVLDIDPQAEIVCSPEGKQALREKGSIVRESTHRRKDGSTFPVEISVRYVQLERGYFVTVVRDISERKQADRALRESEDRYRDLVDNSEDLVCTHDLSGKLLSVNPAASRLLGYSADELLRIPMRQLIAPEFRAEFDQYVTRISENGCDRGFLCVVAKDGRRRVWEYRNTLRKEGVLSPIVRGIARDVTEQHKAEDALRRSEQRMRLFVERAPAGAALLDCEMRYVQASRRWRDDYGLGDREMICVSHYELFPEIPERWKEAHRRCLAGEVLRHDCDRFDRADGSVQWVRWELHPWYEKGKIGGIAIFSEDVTIREKAVEALRQSEKRYRTLFEKAVAGVGMISFDGRILDCNDAWARMFGYKDAAVCRWNSIIRHYRHLSQREILVAELKASGAFLNQEWELLRIDGSPFWVLLNSVLITGEDGEPLIQSTMFEITKRKRAEDALRRSEEHFRILVEQASDGILLQISRENIWTSTPRGPKCWAIPGRRSSTVQSPMLS